MKWESVEGKRLGDLARLVSTNKDDWSVTGVTPGLDQERYFRVTHGRRVIAIVCVDVPVRVRIDGRNRSLLFVNSAEVHPDFRKRGIGRWIVDRIYETAKGMGATVIGLYSTTAAQDFWRYMGFERREVYLAGKMMRKFVRDRPRRIRS